MLKLLGYGGFCFQFMEQYLHDLDTTGNGSIMHIRDVMTQDMPINQSNYDHYSAWEGNFYIGPMYLSTQFIWNYYWKFVQTANILIAAVSPEDTNEDHLGYLGRLLLLRFLISGYGSDV